MDPIEVGREQRSRLLSTVEQLGTVNDQLVAMRARIEGLSEQLIQLENLLKQQSDLIASFRNFPRIFVGSVELEAAFGRKRMGTVSLNAFDPE